MKNKKDFKSSYSKMLPFLALMLVVLVLLGTSYAVLTTSISSKGKYIVNVGTLKVVFQGKNDNLVLNNASPMSSTDGIGQNEELTFTVENTGTVRAKYDIIMEEISDGPVKFADVINYVSRKGDGANSSVKVLSQDNYIDKDAQIDNGSPVTYHVKVWLSESAGNTYMNGTFKAKITINSSQI